MPTFHTSRVPVLISLSMLTGIGLLAFTHLHPFAWRVDLHPMWGWTLCGMGVSATALSMLGFFWTTLEEHWIVLIFLCVIGLVMVAAGYDLEWSLLFLSYLAQGFMYSVGLGLTGFGVWQIVTRHSDNAKWSFAATYNQGNKTGYTEGYNEGYAKAYWNEHGKFDEGHAEGRVEGRMEGYEEGFTAGRVEGYVRGHADGRNEGYEDGHTAGHAKGYTYGYDAGRREGHKEGHAEGHARSAQKERRSRSSDPWQVLGIPPGSTQAEIHRARRRQSNLYHSDKVAHLGKELQQLAEEKMKDINRAYEMLTQP